VLLRAGGPQKHRLNLFFGGEAAEKEIYATCVIIYGFSAVLRSKTAENPFFESTRCSKFGMTHV
jgi:hypothetical protein